MIERKFENAVGAKTVRFSHGHLCLVVEALDDAAGKQLLSPEVIEDQLAMAAEGAGDLFHGLDAGPHGLAAPFIEELAGSSRRVVVPELLKGFLEEVTGTLRVTHCGSRSSRAIFPARSSEAKLVWPAPLAYEDISGVVGKIAVPTLSSTGDHDK